MNHAQRTVTLAIRRDNRLAWLAIGALAVGFAFYAGSAKADSNRITAAGTATVQLDRF